MVSLVVVVITLSFSRCVPVQQQFYVLSAACKLVNFLDRWHSHASSPVILTFWRHLHVQDGQKSAKCYSGSITALLNHNTCNSWKILLIIHESNHDIILEEVLMSLVSINLIRFLNCLNQCGRGVPLKLVLPEYWFIGISNVAMIGPCLGIHSTVPLSCSPP